MRARRAERYRLNGEIAEKRLGKKYRGQSVFSRQDLKRAFPTMPLRRLLYLGWAVKLEPEGGEVDEAVSPEGEEGLAEAEVSGGGDGPEGEPEEAPQDEPEDEAEEDEGGEVDEAPPPEEGSTSAPPRRRKRK